MSHSSDGTLLAPPIVRMHGWWPAAIAFGRDPLGLLRTSRANHGDVFTIDMGMLRMSFVLGPEQQQAFFRADPAILDFQAAAAQVMRSILGPNMYASDRLAAHTTTLTRRGLLPSGALAKYTAAIDNEVQTALETWLQVGEIDLFPAISRLVNNITIRCFIGEEVRQNHGEQVAQAYYDVEKYGSSLLSIVFPTLPTPAVHKATAARARILEVLTTVVEARRRAPTAQPDDYLQAWIEHRLEDGSQFTEAEIEAHLLGILFAAHTNTTGIMAWNLCELLEHPALFTEVLAELEQVSEPEPRSLPMLSRCIRETSRLHFTPILARKALQPYSTGQYTIPAGHLVCISPILVHTDPNVFSEPLTYDPMRWDPPELHKTRIAAGEFVQFGLGAHRCPGEHFATMVHARCWHHLLRNAQFSLLTHPLPEPDWSSGGTPFPKGSVRIRVQRRPSPI